MNATRDRSLLDLVTPAFRLVANLEAASWAGLLVGMLFKYVLSVDVELGEALVTLFGRIHGGLVIAYVVLAFATAMRHRWNVATIALAGAATIPPFATVAFDVFAHRTGRYERGEEG